MAKTKSDTLQGTLALLVPEQVSLDRSRRE